MFKNEELDAWVNQHMGICLVRSRSLGGAVAIAHLSNNEAGHVSLARVYGRKALDSRDDDILQVSDPIIGDITSTTLLISLTIQALLSSGLVALEDDVNQHLPHAAALAASFEDPITVENLLCHTSGITATETAASHSPSLQSSVPPLQAHQALLHSIHGIQTIPAGTRRVPHALNFIALAAIIETVTQLPLTAAIVKHVLQPAGMCSGPLQVPSGSQVVRAFWADEDGSIRECGCGARGGGEARGVVSQLNAEQPLIMTVQQALQLLNALQLALPNTESKSGFKSMEPPLRLPWSQSALAACLTPCFDPDGQATGYSRGGFLIWQADGANSELAYIWDASGFEGGDDEDPEAWGGAGHCVFVWLPGAKLSAALASNTTQRGLAKSRPSFCRALAEKLADEFYVAFKPPPCLVPLRKLPRDEVLTLYCLPYAGQSGSKYFHGWAAYFGDFIRAVAVDYAGRARRGGDEAVTRMDHLVQPILAAIVHEQRLRPRPFGLYGHGLGAAAAYCVAKVLAKEYSLHAVHVVVSGCKPPAFVQEKGSPKRGGVSKRGTRPWQAPGVMGNAATMSDNALIKCLERHPRTPPAFKADPETLRSSLAAVRADILCEDSFMSGLAGDLLGHEWQEPTADYCMTVLHAREDPLQTAEDLEGWKDLTNGQVQIVQTAGSHYFLDSKPAQASLGSLITKIMAAHLTTRTSWINC